MGVTLGGGSAPECRSPVKFLPTDIPDVVLIEPDLFLDSRGFFMETWHARKFADAGITAAFVQTSHSKSVKGILRGLHYQIRHPQGKLVRVVAGEIYDVAVDLCRDSRTFGKWTGCWLSAENTRMLWIPPGCAHGFYATSEAAEVVYQSTDFYVPEDERTVRWDDPDLAIAWPLVGGRKPVLSSKDAEGAPFARAECYPGGRPRTGAR